MPLIHSDILANRLADSLDPNLILATPADPDGPLLDGGPYPTLVLMDEDDIILVRFVLWYHDNNPQGPQAGGTNTHPMLSTTENPTGEFGPYDNIHPFYPAGLFGVIGADPQDGVAAINNIPTLKARVDVLTPAQYPFYPVTLVAFEFRDLNDDMVLRGEIVSPGPLEADDTITVTGMPLAYQTEIQMEPANQFEYQAPTASNS